MCEEFVKKYQMYIGGKWEDPSSGAWFETLNPYTAEPWALIPRGNADDAARAVQAAHRAMHVGEWPKLSATQRGALMRKLGDLIAANAQRLAEIEVKDNGKLISEMRGQLNYIPQWYYYFGGLADKIEGAVLPIDKPNMFTYTKHEPVGVVVGIIPWNSPLMLVAWKLAPALAAGNTVVLKPSEFTSASLLEMMSLVEEAGFPPGVINVVTGFGNEVGPSLIEHPRVAKVAFTGSDATGQKIYEGAARGLKRVSLELGGKSPNIVFDDANLDNAVNGAIAGIFAAVGQACIAGSRMLVQESVHDAFVEKLLKATRTIKMGDPMLAETQVGPVANIPQFDKVLSYLDIAKKDGAQLAIGGDRSYRPECGKGLFVEPTVFTNVRNDMRIAQEEVFGPILSVIPFRDDEEAIEIGNDILFGLAAGVWTTSMKRAHAMSDRLKAGMVWVNTYRMVSYMAPFGGYKRSGLGRENGIEAINEYLQTKTVWISTGDEPYPFVLR
ncbi:aldehyde dehydrogenase [Bradyrhizobium sp. KB893862 SZCCT0404]|nr:aldehyde dehydrogenase [Bradyrhizobium sp. KB893862 SZCCT0404]MBR1175233.1 aldehyde dehydrogenase [Bradyrhizobium sp. KB893862 SZCCT0404]